MMHVSGNTALGLGSRDLGRQMLKEQYKKPLPLRLRFDYNNEERKEEVHWWLVGERNRRSNDVTIS